MYYSSEVISLAALEKWDLKGRGVPLLENMPLSRYAHELAEGQLQLLNTPCFRHLLGLLALVLSDLLPIPRVVLEE